MARLNDLFPPLQLMCTAVGPAQAQMALVEAVKHFMQETGLFDDTCRAWYQQGVNEYLMEVPSGRQVVSVMSVTVDGESQTRWSRDGIHNVIRLHDTFADGACIDIVYTWALDGTDNCELPDVLTGQYRMAILNGARMFLHQMFGSQIVDYNVAMIAARQFQEAIVNLKAHRVMNFSNSRPKMRTGIRGRITRASARRLM